MNKIKQALKYSFEVIKPSIMTTNYYLGNYKDVIWLIGDGRSGTTWVSDLINWEKSYREMFEPFHPRCVKEMGFLAPHQYIRPNDAKHPLLDIASDVFSGKFTNKRIDAQNSRLFYRGLLVKDIFANLFAAWVSKQFPTIKIILLIRNPFAVALSKFKKKSWYWLTNPKEFLNQELLCNDYLQPFEGVIKDVGDDYIERQVLIWSIIHYVPFLQLDLNQIHILFYEDIIANPKEELFRLFRYIKPNGNKNAIEEMFKIYSRPSRMSRKGSNIVIRNPLTGNWKKELSVKQIHKGLKILNCFGLDKIYGEDSMPRKGTLEKLLKHFSTA